MSNNKYEQFKAMVKRLTTKDGILAEGTGSDLLETEHARAVLEAIVAGQRSTCKDAYQEASDPFCHGRPKPG